jgi:hypothetical protein
MFKKSFWSDGISVDEERVSVIVVAFIVTLGVVLYTYLATHVVNELMLDLIKFEIGSIVGINVTNTISSGISNMLSPKKENGSKDTESVG